MERYWYKVQARKYKTENDWKKKIILLRKLNKTKKFTKTPSSIPCGGLYYTVDPLNISLFSILFFVFINISGSVL